MLKNPASLLLVLLGLTTLTRRTDCQVAQALLCAGCMDGGSIGGNATLPTALVGVEQRLFLSCVAACKTSSCCLGVRAWVQLIHYNVWVYNLCGYLYIG